MEAPDMESFPLLRPDLIPRLASEWLLAAQRDIAPLIAALAACGPEDSLLHYANQQVSLVEAELARRRAAERVARIMAGQQGPSSPEATGELEGGEGAWRRREAAAEPYPSGTASGAPSAAAGPRVGFAEAGPVADSGRVAFARPPLAPPASAAPAPPPQTQRVVLSSTMMSSGAPRKPTSAGSSRASTAASSRGSSQGTARSGGSGGGSSAPGTPERRAPSSGGSSGGGAAKGNLVSAAEAGARREFVVEASSGGRKKRMWETSPSKLGKAKGKGKGEGGVSSGGRGSAGSSSGVKTSTAAGSSGSTSSRGSTAKPASAGAAASRGGSASAAPAAGAPPSFSVGPAASTTTTRTSSAGSKTTPSVATGGKVMTAPVSGSSKPEGNRGGSGSSTPARAGSSVAASKEKTAASNHSSESLTEATEARASTAVSSSSACGTKAAKPRSSKSGAVGTEGKAAASDDSTEEEDDATIITIEAAKPARTVATSSTSGGSAAARSSSGGAAGKGQGAAQAAGTKAAQRGALAAEGDPTVHADQTYRSASGGKSSVSRYGRHPVDESEDEAEEAEEAEDEEEEGDAPVDEEEGEDEGCYDGDGAEDEGASHEDGAEDGVQTLSVHRSGSAEVAAVAWGTGVDDAPRRPRSSAGVRMAAAAVGRAAGAGAMPDGGLHVHAASAPAGSSRHHRVTGPSETVRAPAQPQGRGSHVDMPIGSAVAADGKDEHLQSEEEEEEATHNVGPDLAVEDAAEDGGGAPHTPGGVVNAPPRAVRVPTKAGYVDHAPTLNGLSVSAARSTGASASALSTGTSVPSVPFFSPASEVAAWHAEGATGPIAHISSSSFASQQPSALSSAPAHAAAPVAVSPWAGERPSTSRPASGSAPAAAATTSGHLFLEALPGETEAPAWSLPAAPRSRVSSAGPPASTTPAADAPRPLDNDAEAETAFTDAVSGTEAVTVTPRPLLVRPGDEDPLKARFAAADAAAASGTASGGLNGEPPATPRSRGASTPTAAAATQPQSQLTYASIYPDLASIFTASRGALPSAAQGGFSARSSASTAGASTSLKLDAVMRAISANMRSFALRARGEEAGELDLSCFASDADDDGDDGDAPAVAVREVPAAFAALAAAAPTPLARFPPVHPVPRHFRIASSHGEVLAIVRRALAASGGWEEVPPEYGNLPVWNLMWSWGKPPIQRNRLMMWQRVNHFKHARELTRKDMLKKNLARYQCLGGKMASAFALQPPTFVLPKEYLAFAEVYGRGSRTGALPSAAAAATTGAAGAAGPEAEAPGADDPLAKLVAAFGIRGAAGKGAAAAGSSATPRPGGGAGALPPRPAPLPPGTDPNLWILKPSGLSRGRGIELISDISQIQYKEDAVIQKYIHNPLLLDGYKFDLRLYVCVTSFRPLEAFLYRRGFARLSSRPFTADPSQIADKFIHLTNSSVQRYSDTAKSTMAALAGGDAEHVGGTKCSLEFLWRKLRERGIDTDAAWEAIIDLVVKSLVCVDDVIPHQPNSFEVYGYDVLLDSNLKPWLVEVNASPSLGVDSAMDLAIKTQMIADTVALVEPLAFDHEALGAWLRREADRGAAGTTAGPAFDAELRRVLGGAKPRPVGAAPSYMGDYQRICPGTDAFNRVMKLKFTNFRAPGGGGSGGAGAGGAPPKPGKAGVAK